MSWFKHEKGHIEFLNLVLFAHKTFGHVLGWI